MVQNNEVSIQEQLRDAEVAEEPGNIKAGSCLLYTSPSPRD